MNNKYNHLGKAFVIGMILNLLFVIIESTAGFMSNSMGLLSDAGHNLCDTISLLLAWFAYRLTRVSANSRYTYGYGKSTVLASLVNAFILLVAVGGIFVESIRKLSNPQKVDENAIIWVATAGIVVNFITAMLFMKDRKKDLNVRGTFLHMIMDTLVSVGVVVSGIVIKFTGWTMIDPIIGLAISVIIFWSTKELLRQSIRLSLDGVPDGIDLAEIEKIILGIDGVTGIHHVHVWALGTSENALTVHVSVRNTVESERIKTDIRRELSSHGIMHATIETEPQDYKCPEYECKHNRAFELKQVK
ncbi:MAG: cation diffusion facilitator family transporter [Bacteroidales bacterium]|jgi:cobalt-zinc-cadmium efflux system protein|nr:cation diffusion facilitator family transporter [Bacteroidales bacterium]